jgi:eukaryotic-like serine/threonine-protein kinase
VVLDKLALNHLALGRAAESEQETRRALAIWKQLLGEDNPYLAISYNNLGETLQTEKKYEEAAAMIERAVALDEKGLGPEDQDVGSDLNNLGLVYMALKRYPDAEKTFERAVAIRRKALGNDSPVLASTLAAYGQALYANGHAAKGNVARAEAEAILRNK